MQRDEVIRHIVQLDVQRHGLDEEQALQEWPNLYAAACEHFGTWFTALHYAGIDVRRKAKGPKISGEEVLRAIRELCRDGYNLTTDHMLRRDRRLYEAARRHFGTWRRAMIAAGINVQYVHLPARPGRFSKPQIIEALQQRQRAGLSLAWGAVCLDNRVLANAAKNGFRRWRLALEAAGVAPEKSPATKHRESSPEK
jgi:hypothetical protein